MDVDDVRRLLAQACEAVGSQRAWAKQNGLSSAYVNDVVTGKREPGAAILERLGLEKAVVYRSTKDQGR